MRYFKALKGLPVTICVLIFFTYPMFTLLFGCIFFGEPLKKHHILLTILILSDCLFTLYPTTHFSFEEWATIGWCFVAPLGVTVLILIFSLRINKLKPLPATAYMLVGNTLVGLFSVL